MKKKRIHKISKTIAASTVILSLLFSGPSYSVANADTLSSLKEQYAALQSQQQELQEKYNELNQKVSTEKEKRDAINENVKVLRSQIDLLNTQIDELNSQIKTTNEDIAKTEEKIENENERYKERVCTIYEVGTSSKLEVLLTSKNLSDFLIKFDTLKAVSDYDKELIENLTNDRENLQNQKKSLEDKKTDFEQSKGTLDAKKQILDSQLAEQQAIVDALKNDANKVSNAKKEVKKQEAKTDAEIQAEIDRVAEERRKELAAKNHGDVTYEKDANAILGYARGFIDTPYRLGANDPPNAIDCSAFVMRVFAHFGITLQRCSGDQVSAGVEVPKSQIKPCDLVFFDTKGAGVSHVGIYMGNGKFIAANSGKSEHGVGIWNLNSDYWAPKFIEARRIIN